MSVLGASVDVPAPIDGLVDSSWKLSPEGLTKSCPGVAVREFLSSPVWLCHWAQVSVLPVSSDWKRLPTTL